MLSSKTARNRLTVKELRRLPDDGKRHEVVDGVHYVSSAPNLDHQATLGRLYLALGNFLRTRPELGRVFLGPVDIILSLYDLVVPDLIVVGADQLRIMTARNIQGAPAIVVEVLSPTTRRRDEGVKRALFERTGVRDYWLVDPKRQTVSILRRGKTGFTTKEILQGAELLTTPILPGFRVAASDLFADR